MCLSGAAATAAAQSGPRPSEDLTRRLAGIAAVTGLEQQLVDTLLSLLPGARRDRAGNAVLTLGTGPSRRLAVCPLDEPGYVVGHLRDDGYLTLRRSPGSISHTRDAQLEGQRVSIVTPWGIVPGVIAVRSVHLTRGRERVPVRFTVDSALVDIGAASKGDVEALGIRPLAPVTLAKRPHRYGDGLIAAPAAARRAACAALVVAARRAAAEQGMIPRRQSVVIAFVVEDEISSRRGLGTVVNSAGPFQESVLVAADSAGAADAVARWPSLGMVAGMPLPARYAGTAVETVALGDVERMAADLAAWIRGPR